MDPVMKLSNIAVTVQTSVSFRTLDMPRYPGQIIGMSGEFDGFIAVYCL